MRIFCHLRIHSWYPYVVEMWQRQVAGFPPVMQRCHRRGCEANRLVWGIILERTAIRQEDFEFYWRWGDEDHPRDS